MTDRDPKDMTASELLRQSDSNPCSMCHLVLAGDESCATTGCASWAYRLADKIDAELAEVKKKAAHATDKPLSEVIAFYTGLYAKGAEPIGDWLDRWFIPRPRFEDGEPVQFGEEVELHYKSGGCDKGRFQEIKYNKGSVWILSFTGVDHASEYRYDSERDVLKRPAPEVLLGDGKPVSKGETVYVIESGIGRIVSAFGTKLCKGMDGWDGSPWVMFGNGSWMHARDLTHTPPDTQQKIDEDAEKFYCAYFGGYGACGTCPASAGELSKKSCKQQQILDLLRRQRELDKRTGGDA